jgi:hypothetical protein
VQAEKMPNKNPADRKLVAFKGHHDIEHLAEKVVFQFIDSSKHVALPDAP